MKMKPADVKSNAYINLAVENNDKDLKFKARGCVRMWKYKSIFAKDHIPNCS